MEFRVEKDSIGSKKVPKDVYYGVQSLRGHENFRISGMSLEESFIRSLALVKKACAITNCEVGELKDKIKDGIVKACDKIINGNYMDQFILDPIQGGAGTSTNMNMNEVLANLANEILGYEKGLQYPVHPNDHVNMGQSTNDVIPTAGLINCHGLLEYCLEELRDFENALLNKGKEFEDVIKMGRTEMQDAVPISLGSEFIAYSRAIRRDINRLESRQTELLKVNLGGTAVGTGINANPDYIKEVVGNLRMLTELNITQAEDLIDATQNADTIAALSSDLKVCAVNLSKIAGDLILMSSGPRTGFSEINLPAKQNGSSIMPGKVNPVMPELLKQIAFQIIGNDTTVTLAASSGQLELNAFYPIILLNVFQSIRILTNGVHTLTKNCINGVEANEERCKELVEKSIGIVTAFAPSLGYERSAFIAKKALKLNRNIKEVIKEELGLSDEEITKTLNIDKMVKISG
ncbi:aspartate ammonia-lyase [Clostridium sardiniense]|uniref:aspartate ammonia-lyase n=1 Tax=Clostridium sardiniense TaxID=29369 RepID=UPI0019567189|nr:aspartate ammonia-lyase [Clostridium sardiniense]MBM7833032.1 aspartate ammonia-lyase [Clostridium sardiniense]